MTTAEATLMAPERDCEDPATFEPEAEPVDVEALMERVRRAVEEKRRAGVYREDDWPSDLHYGAPAQPGRDGLGLLRAAARVDLDGEAIRSHRPFSGAVVMAIKRFTRYWVRKYTDPLFLRQAAFNAESVNALAALKSEVEELREEVARLKAQPQAAPPPDSDR